MGLGSVTSRHQGWGRSPSCSQNTVNGGVDQMEMQQVWWMRLQQAAQARGKPQVQTTADGQRIGHKVVLNAQGAQRAQVMARLLQPENGGFYAVITQPVA